MSLTIQQIMKALGIKEANEENNIKMFQAKRLDVSFLSLEKLNHMTLLNNFIELRISHNALNCTK